MTTLWLSRGHEHVPRRTAWLSDPERAYVASKRFTKRSSEFLIARWTMKNAVAVALSLPPDDHVLARIEARHAADGAPELYVDGAPAPYDVSLTDRADWAVCVLAPPGAGVGVDLELVEPRSEAFVRDYLTQREQEQVAVAPDPALAANLLWSAKESALKVLRTGLRRDTRSVEVTLTSMHVEERVWSPLSVQTTEGDSFNGWWRRSGAFLLTTCTRRPLVDPPRALDPAASLDSAEPSHRWASSPVRL